MKLLINNIPTAVCGKCRQPVGQHAPGCLGGMHIAKARAIDRTCDHGYIKCKQCYCPKCGLRSGCCCPVDPPRFAEMVAAMPDAHQLDACSEDQCYRLLRVPDTGNCWVIPYSDVESASILAVLMGYAVASLDSLHEPESTPSSRIPTTPRAFKVGDRVRCVDPILHLHRGEVFEVEGVRFEGDVLDLKGDIRGVFASRFVLAEPAEPEGADREGWELASWRRSGKVWILAPGCWASEGGDWHCKVVGSLPVVGTCSTLLEAQLAVERAVRE